MWKTVILVEVEDWDQTGALWSDARPHSAEHPGLQGPHCGNALGSPPSFVKEYLCSYQGTGLRLPLRGGRFGAANAAGQGRVAVVVVGVTPHRGVRESRAQGKGLQVMSF